MKRFNLALGVVIAGLALTASPALAQRPSESGSHGGGDHAVDRGSAGGGGGSTAGTATSSTTSSSASSSSPSAGVASSPSVGRAESMYRESAPQHRAGSGGGQHTASSSPRGSSGDHRASGGDRATPRAEGSVDRGSNRAAGASASRPSDSNDTRAVPSWARPRGDRPATDTAVDRTTPRRGGTGGNPSYYYDPFYGGGYGYYGGYGRYGYYSPAYFDPFFDPFYFPGFAGYGMGMGLGAYPYMDPFYDPSGDPYTYGVGGGYSSGSYSSGNYGSRDQGNLKLKVKPRSAKVYVDGYYVGAVDEFDGAFQKLPLNAGRHKVRIEAEGYETAEFDTVITPEQTVTFQGQLKKVQ